MLFLFALYNYYVYSDTSSYQQLSEKLHTFFIIEDFQSKGKILNKQE